MDREQYDQIEENLGDDSLMVHKLLKVLYKTGGLPSSKVASKLGIDITETERLIAVAAREGLIE